MKCCIAKDLLPLYAEQLTGEETAAEIRAHLEQCEECAALFAEMQAQQQPAIAAPEDISPLKAVRQRGRRRTLIAAVIAAAAAAMLPILFIRFFLVGTQLRSDQITMEIETYWVDYNADRPSPKLKRFYNYEEAEAAMQEPDAGTLYEQVAVTLKCDCLSVRVDSANAWTSAESDTPVQYRAKADDIAFYSVLMPYLSLERNFFHKSLWPRRSIHGTATAGSVIMIRCKDGNFGYQLTDLAALADASPDGKATLTVGEKIPAADS